MILRVLYSAGVRGDTPAPAFGSRARQQRLSDEPYVVTMSLEGLDAARVGVATPSASQASPAISAGVDQRNRHVPTHAGSGLRPPLVA